MKKKIKSVPKGVAVHEKWGPLTETYWAPLTEKTLSVSIEFKNEKTGEYEKKEVINPKTGYPKMSGNHVEYLTEYIKFSKYHNSPGMTHKKEDNSWCFYPVFEDTPNYIKKRLIFLQKKGAIYTDDEKMKMDNPEHFKQYKKNKALETKCQNTEQENAKLLARIKELEGK